MLQPAPAHADVPLCVDPPWRPAARRDLIALTEHAPRAVAGPAGTFSKVMVSLIDRGAHRARAAEKRRAQPAFSALIAWGTAHCTEVRRVVAGESAPSYARSAQEALRIAMTDAKVISADTDSCAGVSPTVLGAAEPSLHLVTGPTDPKDPKAVSVHVVDPHTIVLAAGTGYDCYFLRDDTERGTEFAKARGGRCDAASPPATFTTRWK